MGSWARWGVASAAPVAAGTFPTTTLVINVVGAALLGFVLVALLDVPPVHHRLHALLGTGVLGAFTTFSTFSMETVTLARSGHLVTAVLYVGLTIALCIAGSMLGLIWFGKTS